MNYKTKSNSIENKIVDIHCHELPCVDDGAKDMNESIKMLKIAQNEGITHAILTPHFKNTNRNITREKLLDLFKTYKTKVTQCGITMQLYLGNEVLYFRDIEEAIEQRNVFTMNDSEYLLIEFLPQDTFSCMRNGLEDIAGIGLKPILAHIERYECMIKHIEYAKELHDLGVRLQVNASSIVGELGTDIKRYTHKLLKYQLIDYIATDAHSSGKRSPRIKKCLRLVKRKFGKEYAEKLFGGNALKDMNL